MSGIAPSAGGCGWAAGFRVNGRWHPVALTSQDPTLTMRDLFSPTLRGQTVRAEFRFADLIARGTNLKDCMQHCG